MIQDTNPNVEAIEVVDASASADAPALDTAHQLLAGTREFYYYPKGKSIFTTNSAGDWVCLDDTNVRKLLVHEGKSDTLTKKEIKSGVRSTEVDLAILDIKMEKIVRYVGPVAGWKRGRHLMNGKWVLVTEELDVVRPRKPAADAAARADGSCKGWPVLGGQFARWLSSKGWGWVKNDFGQYEPDAEGKMPEGFRPEDEGFDQRAYYFAWLARWYRAILEAEPALGHAVVFAGNTGCGKTLNVMLLEQMFGGEAAQPYSYLMGGQFNADLPTSTVMTIDDEVSKTDMKSRKDLGARVKQFVAVPKLRVEGKGADAVILSPVNRLIFCTNLTEDNLSVLPPPSEDLIDADGKSGKMMLFKFYSHGWEAPFSTKAEQGAFFRTLRAELPCFLWWLLNEFRLPAEHYDDRFGVVPWMHPEILEALEELSPWQRILSLIDRVLFLEGGRDFWVVTSDSLHGLLTNEDSSLPIFEKQQLRASYLHLGEIAQKRPDRCQDLKSAARGKMRAFVLYREGAKTDDAPQRKAIKDSLAELIARKARGQPQKKPAAPSGDRDAF